MFRTIVFGAMLGACSSVALAQANCAAFSESIEGRLKKIASEMYGEGMTDNSVPRETNRLLRIQNEIGLIAVETNLLAQNKCPPPKEPMDPGAYASNALQCGIKTRMATDKTAVVEECNRKKWSRSQSSIDR